MTPPDALLLDVPVPEHLPGEPVYPRPSRLGLALRVARQALLVALIASLTLGLWPLYWLGAAVWGWPPNVPRVAQIRRYLGWIWTASPPPPGLPALARISLTLEVLRKIAVIPLWGSAWLLDLALYGRQLRATPVVAPLIEISAARSGSTQLARYLEEDPHLAAPSMLQSVFPYLWLWRLAPHTLGRILTPDRVRHKMETTMPREFLERHEGDPFRTDTFDAALYISHLNMLSGHLGPDIMAQEFGMGAFAPHNQALWEEDFVALFDGIGRKTLLQAGPGKRLFIKGHFLAAADALERRYPDARFLTMIRAPGPRLQSGVNFLRANPGDGVLGPVPWAWLGATLASTESTYCERELRWFTRTDGARRCVIRFQDYVADLEATMTRVYQECLDTAPLPAHVPRVHPPRQRTNYLLNRSLAQVGVSEAALHARLADYLVWCQGPSPSVSSR